MYLHLGRLVYSICGPLISSNIWNDHANFHLTKSHTRRVQSKYLLLLVDTNRSKTFFFVNFPKSVILLVCARLKDFPNQISVPSLEGWSLFIEADLGRQSGQRALRNWQSWLCARVRYNTTTQCKQSYNSRSIPIKVYVTKYNPCIRYKQSHSVPVGLIEFLSAVVNNCVSTEHWVHFTMHINTHTVQRLLCICWKSKYIF